ncbi:alpha-ketoacid dehydrogenase subunit beta [Micromonospora zamorensis]|uniref:alpha-ketoacid dehydrogenase subunit beta n=1 Tax=Micromonospora zamorensis TaxID=709883 RepID=UPI003D8D4D12
MRVAESINLALHTVLAEDPRAYLVGEDIADPYGGAFKVTKGLSTRYPGRVLSSPLSESGIVGFASGLALAGDTAIVEIMFGDFLALAFDQIVNFASKSVSMYGRHQPMPLVVRCPVGGGRGYGPTHSQNLQKHFIGVPGLSLYEISPFHDPRTLLAEIIDRAVPAILFEDKVLYTRQMFEDGAAGEFFSYQVGPGGVARVFADAPEACECVLIVPGGLAHRALAAARTLLLEDEIACLLLVPSRLYPLDVEALSPLPAGARAICIAEDGTAGGTWGQQVAYDLQTRLGYRPPGSVTLVNAADRVIPAAPHLEERVMVSEWSIRNAVKRALRD